MLCKHGDSLKDNSLSFKYVPKNIKQLGDEIISWSVGLFPIKSRVRTVPVIVVLRASVSVLSLLLLLSATYKADVRSCY